MEINSADLPPEARHDLSSDLSYPVSSDLSLSVSSNVSEPVLVLNVSSVLSSSNATDPIHYRMNL